MVNPLIYLLDGQRPLLVVPEAVEELAVLLDVLQRFLVKGAFLPFLLQALFVFADVFVPTVLLKAVYLILGE